MEDEETKQEPTNEPVAKDEDKEMWDVLVDLSKTKYWRAISRYVRLRDAYVMGSLVNLDPFKDPTAVARTQGIRTGLYDLEHAVNAKISQREEGTDI